MITNKQLDFLKHPDKYPKKYHKLYYQRIQDTITKNFDNGLWLAKHRPDVLLNHVAGMIRMDEPRHKRIQQLLLLVKILRPECDVYLEFAKEIKDLEDGEIETK